MTASLHYSIGRVLFSTSRDSTWKKKSQRDRQRRITVAIFFVFFFFLIGLSCEESNLSFSFIRILWIRTVSFPIPRQQTTHRLPVDVVRNNVVGEDGVVDGAGGRERCSRRCSDDDGNDGSREQVETRHLWSFASLDALGGERRRRGVSRARSESHKHACTRSERERERERTNVLSSLSRRKKKKEKCEKDEKLLCRQERGKEKNSKTTNGTPPPLRSTFHA